MELKALFPKRRDGGYGSVTLVINNKRVPHAIGSDGIVTVPDEYAAGLIGTRNFIAAEDALPVASANTPSTEQTGCQQMLITNGEETADLMTMNKSALLELSKEMGLEFTARNSVQTLRDGIYAHVNQ